jgi:acetyl esterase/lipase
MKTVTHTYKQVDNLKIRADVHMPDSGGPWPVIFWIHGGALMGGHRGNISDWQRDMYLDAGYVVVSIDYRLAPETKIVGIIEDIEDAWRWVIEQGPELFNADTSRTAVMGHSAGGYLTLMTGFRCNPRPRALVSFYGYGDIIGPWYSAPDPFYCSQDAVAEDDAHAAVGTEPLTGTRGPSDRGRYYLYCRQNGLWPKAVADHDPHTEPDAFTPYMPVLNVDATYPATMLLHGTADTDVPHEQSVMMAAEVGKVGIEHEFVSIPDGGHGFDGWGLEKEDVRAAFDRVMPFLKAHL